MSREWVWIPIEIIDKLVPLECSLEPFWRGNEVILNKGYFQHKMFNRSNASRLLQVSEETEWKAHWWNTANRQMFLFPWGKQLTGFRLGENSLVVGLGNEHLLGRPCEHYLCQRLCEKYLFPLWCGFERKMASHWRKRIWSLSGPIFLVLYNSFLCHCLTSIIRMLPDNFLPLFLLHGGLFVKNKDANVALTVECMSVCVCVCWV